MQHRFVLLVRNGAQHFALQARGVPQHAERLIRMAGHEHLIETLGASRARLHQHAVPHAPHAHHRRIEANAVLEGRNQFLDIARRTAADGAPLRAVVHRQHAVVVEETDEEARRKGQHARRIGGPDGRPHGDEVIADERLAVTLEVQVVAEADIDFAIEQPRRFAIEAQDVADHAVEARPEQVAALGEQRIDAGAVVFQTGRFVPHAETHVALLRGHAQFVHQRDEVRVGPVIEDDESGVDGVALALILDVVGMRVAADVAAGFEQRDVVLAMQVMRDDIAGNTAADDGDALPAGFVQCEGLRGVHTASPAVAIDLGTDGLPSASTRRAARTRCGTPFRSRITPSAASALRPYQVRSTSHQ